MSKRSCSGNTFNRSRKNHLHALEKETLMVLNDLALNCSGDSAGKVLDIKIFGDAWHDTVNQQKMTMMS